MSIKAGSLTKRVSSSNILFVNTILAQEHKINNYSYQHAKNFLRGRPIFSYRGSLNYSIVIVMVSKVHIGVLVTNMYSLLTKYSLVNKYLTNARVNTLEFSSGRGK